MSWGNPTIADWDKKGLFPDDRRTIRVNTIEKYSWDVVSFNKDFTKIPGSSLLFITRLVNSLKRSLDVKNECFYDSLFFLLLMFKAPFKEENIKEFITLGGFELILIVLQLNPTNHSLNIAAGLQLMKILCSHSFDVKLRVRKSLNIVLNIMARSVSSRIHKFSIALVSDMTKEISLYSIVQLLKSPHPCGKRSGLKMLSLVLMDNSCIKQILESTIPTADIFNEPSNTDSKDPFGDDDIKCLWTVEVFPHIIRAMFSQPVVLQYEAADLLVGLILIFLFHGDDDGTILVVLLLLLLVLLLHGSSKYCKDCNALR